MIAFLNDIDEYTSRIEMDSELLELHHELTILELNKVKQINLIVLELMTLHPSNAKLYLKLIK